jgi:hypothetical protein
MPRANHAPGSGRRGPPAAAPPHLWTISPRAIAASMSASSVAHLVDLEL